MTTRLRSISPLQFATVAAVLYALIAFVIALFFAAFAAMASSLPFANAGLHSWTGASAIVIVLVLPIFYGVCGFIGGLITAFVYNLVAGWTGGIELTFNVAPQPTGTTLTSPTL